MLYLKTVIGLFCLFRRHNIHVLCGSVVEYIIEYIYVIMLSKEVAADTLSVYALSLYLHTYTPVCTA